MHPLDPDIQASAELYNNVRELLAGRSIESRDGSAKSWTAKELVVSLPQIKDGEILNLGLERLAKKGMSRQHVAQFLFWVRWAESGFPTVKTTAKFVAAMMATKVSAFALNDIRSPWRCFKICLPKGVLFTQVDTEESATEIYALGPQFDDFEWSFYAQSTGTIAYRKLLFDIRDLSSLDDDRLTDEQRSASMLMGRVILGTICALTNSEHVEKVDKSVHRDYEARGSHRAFAYPTARVFKIIAPVTVDLTKELREWQLAKRGHGCPTVQSLVCGHWKHQPHGPHSSLRKWMWLQPYWRGPEDGPIAFRPHQINGAPCL